MNDLTFDFNRLKYSITQIHAWSVKSRKLFLINTLVFFVCSLSHIFLPSQLSSFIPTCLSSDQDLHPSILLFRYLFLSYFTPTPFLLHVDFNGISLTKHQSRDTVQRKNRTHKVCSFKCSFSSIDWAPRLSDSPAVSVNSHHHSASYFKSSSSCSLQITSPVTYLELIILSLISEQTNAIIIGNLFMPNP